MRLQLAFYKISSKTSTNIDKIIGFYTRSKYSHVELVLGNRMYSASSSRDAVRYKENIIDDEKWDYLYIDIENISSMNEFIKSTMGKKYDFAGIFGFVIPFRDNENRYFCSEWVSKAMLIGGYKSMLTKNPSRMSPERLYNMVINSNEKKGR